MFLGDVVDGEGVVGAEIGQFGAVGAQGDLLDGANGRDVAAVEAVLEAD